MKNRLFFEQIRIILAKRQLYDKRMFHIIGGNNLHISITENLDYFNFFSHTDDLLLYEIAMSSK